MISTQVFHTFLKVAAILCGCSFFLGCENDELVIKELTEKKVMVDEAKNVTTLFSQQGVLKAKLTAPLMLRYETDTAYTEFPKSLHVLFYDSAIHVESELDARYAKYYQTRGKVFLRDSVVIFNIKGDTLRCPELWWDQNEKKFYTDKLVRIHTKDRQINGGKGLEAGQDFTWYIIKKPTGTVMLPGDMVPQ